MSASGLPSHKAYDPYICNEQKNTRAHISQLIQKVCRLSESVVDSGGNQGFPLADGRGAPLGPNSFIFMHFSVKILPKNRFSPKLKGWRPSPRPVKPGCATESLFRRLDLRSIFSPCSICVYACLFVFGAHKGHL